MNLTKKEAERFWHIRSTNYDKLFWVKDKDYIDKVIEAAELKKYHTVLDVGTGIGKIAAALNKKVRHVVAIDISNSMLQKGDWTGISTIKWDIGESFFADSLFHRVFARMCFHHILDNLDRAIIRCYDLLKEDGKIIVAEGVPPVDNPDVVEWYTEMFKLKEKRRTFTPNELVYYLTKNGFKNVSCKTYHMENFSVYNWVVNSGLGKTRQDKIIRVHKEASSRIKKVFNMRITDDDCVIRTKNVIVVGEK